jgi:hypothetical protein
VLKGEYNGAGVPILRDNSQGIELRCDPKPLPRRVGEKLTSKNNIESPEYPYSYRTGGFMSSLDILVFNLNIASSGSSRYISQLVAVLVRETPEIQTLVIKITISLPPYKWWSAERFRY